MDTATSKSKLWACRIDTRSQARNPLDAWYSHWGFVIHTLLAYSCKARYLTMSLSLQLHHTNAIKFSLAQTPKLACPSTKSSQHIPTPTSAPEAHPSTFIYHVISSWLIFAKVLDIRSCCRRSNAAPMRRPLVLFQIWIAHFTEPTGFTKDGIVAPVAFLCGRDDFLARWVTSLYARDLSIFVFLHHFHRR